MPRKISKDDEESASIPLIVTRRSKIFVRNNQDIVDVLFSHASSSKQIVMVTSAKGYTTFASLSSIISPGPAPFLVLGQLQILDLFAIFNPTNTISEEQFELQDSVLGVLSIPYTTMVSVKLMGLVEDRYTAHRLVAAGQVELEVAFIGGIRLELHMDRLKKERELTNRLEAEKRPQDDTQQRRND